MALDPVTLSTPYVLDASTTITAIAANYSYLFEDRVELHTLPSNVPTLVIAYDGSAFEDGGTVIKLSAMDTATVQAAVTLLKNKIQARLENFPGP